MAAAEGRMNNRSIEELRDIPLNTEDLARNTWDVVSDREKASRNEDPDNDDEDNEDYFR